MAWALRCHRDTGQAGPDTHTDTQTHTRRGPSPAAREAQPRTLTVKRLERRLDCLRTGVGVLAVGGTSMRSSFWLVLGVDGTEEE